MNDSATPAPKPELTPQQASQQLIASFELRPRKPLFELEELLRAGANPDTRGNSGTTSLHYASSNNDLDAVQLLLRYNADINIRDNYGNTPLHYAARNRGIEVVRDLLKKGADPSLTNKAGDNTLTIASQWPASHYDNEADKFLVPHPLTDIHHRNHLGLSALDVAMKQSAIRLVSRLAQAGAYVPESYASNFNIRNRLQEAHKRWDTFCNSADRTATTIADLMHFSNIGHLGDALNPRMWNGQHTQLRTLFDALHPCHQQRALEESPALQYFLIQDTPKTIIAQPILTPPPKDHNRERQ